MMSLVNNQFDGSFNLQSANEIYMSHLCLLYEWNKMALQCHNQYTGSLNTNIYTDIHNGKL